MSLLKCFDQSFGLNQLYKLDRTPLQHMAVIHHSLLFVSVVFLRMRELIYSRCRWEFQNKAQD